MLPLRFVLLIGALASCASTSMPRTGFLENYDQLQPAPARTVTFIPDSVDLYLHPGLEARSYRSLIVEPVEWRPIEGSETALSQDKAQKLTRYYARKMRAALARDFEIVEAPRGDTVRLRAAITEVDRSNVWVNSLAFILLFPVDMGGIAGELEVVDASTGERVLAMTTCRDGTPFLAVECFNHLGHARHGIKKWARLVRDLLQGETETSATAES